MHYPADTGRKLNVHKTFRRRPGCLLNILCTFNLCPVSREEGNRFSDDFTRADYLFALIRLILEKTFGEDP